MGLFDGLATFVPASIVIESLPVIKCHTYGCKGALRWLYKVELRNC